MFLTGFEAFQKATRADVTYLCTHPGHKTVIFAFFSVFSRSADDRDGDVDLAFEFHTIDTPK